MKILGVAYTYNKPLFDEKNFELIVEKMNDTLALLYGVGEILLLVVELLFSKLWLYQR